MKKLATLFITALLFLGGCSIVPITGRKQILLVSDQEVLSSSLTQYSDYIKSAPISTNAKGTAMVTRVGKKIAAATEQYLKNNGLSAEISNFSWEFKLVKDNQINAFCMPGGKIVVYEGLLKLVSSDDELAVVLGHEVAHAVAKHSNERLSQQLMTQYGAQILTQALSKKSAAIQQAGSAIYGLGAQYGLKSLQDLCELMHKLQMELFRFLGVRNDDEWLKNPQIVLVDYCVHDVNHEMWYIKNGWHEVTPNTIIMLQAFLQNLHMLLDGKIPEKPIGYTMSSSFLQKRTTCCCNPLYSS